MKHLTLAALALRGMLSVSGANAQDIGHDFGPKDIRYLANMHELHEPYFETNVKGVARFTGVGIVRKSAIADWYRVDFGQGIYISCRYPSGTPLPPFVIGERVAVTGTVDGAGTKNSEYVLNAISRDIDPSKPLPYPDIADSLHLLGATCDVVKAS
jgi:hypothetical protein